MHVIIASPRMVISDKLQQLIRVKVAHLGKMSDRITKCMVVLRKQKNDQNQGSLIQIQLALPQKTLFATEQADTFERAVDMIIDDLGSQLRRYKSERDKSNQRASAQPDHNQRF